MSSNDSPPSDKKPIPTRKSELVPVRTLLHRQDRNDFACRCDGSRRRSNCGQLSAFSRPLCGSSATVIPPPTSCGSSADRWQWRGWLGREGRQREWVVRRGPASHISTTSVWCLFRSADVEIDDCQVLMQASNWYASNPFPSWIPKLLFSSRLLSDSTSAPVRWCRKRGFSWRPARTAESGCSNASAAMGSPS